MHHRIHRQRQVELARPFRDFDLLVVRVLEAGDAVGDDGLVALKADLHMAEPGIGQRGELFAGQQHRRGDEIGVEPDVAGMLDQFDQVLARGRLAAGEMDLQHADLGEFGQHLLPFLRRQVRCRRDRARPDWSNRGIAAGSDGSARRARRAECRTSPRSSGALSSTARPSPGSAGLPVGEHFVHDVFSRASRQKSLVGEVLQHGDDVGRDRLARRGVFCRELIDHRRDAADAVAEFQHFDGDLVRRQHALRRQDHPDLPGLVEFQLGMPRQHRPARLADADVARARHRFCLFASLFLGTKAPGGMWPST